MTASTFRVGQQEIPTDVLRRISTYGGKRRTKRKKLGSMRKH